jgi:hypothetical protein
MTARWQIPEPAEVTVDSGRLVSLHFLLAALRRRWLTWVSVTVAGLVLGLTWVALVPPSSVGTVTIFLAHDPNVEPQGAMATDVSLLRTRSVASAATRRLDLDMAPEEFQATVAAISVTPEVLTINVDAPEDGTARERAAVLASEFLAFRSAQLRAGADAIVARNRERVRTLEAQAAVLTDEFERLSAAGQQGQSEAAAVLTERSQLMEEIVRLQQSSEETSLKIEAVLSASAVVDPAEVVPRSTVKRWVLTIGSMLVGGLVAGVGYVLVTALASNRLRRRDDVAQAVGAPVAASTRRRSRSALTSAVRAVVAASEVEGGRARMAVAGVGRTRDHERLATEVVLTLVQQGRSVFLVDLSRRGRWQRQVHRRVNRHARWAQRPPGVRPGHGAGAAVSRRSTGPARPLLEREDERSAAYGAADVVLSLAEIDPATDLDELAAWADEVALVVAAGRSSAERLRSVSELVHTAGMHLAFVVLTRADRTDESVGLVGDPRPADVVPGQTDGVSSDALRERPSARRSVR